MSSESAVTGTPRQITFRGKGYAVGLVTGRVKGRFEQLWVAHARDRLAEDVKRAGLTREEYVTGLQRIADKEDQGDFAFLCEKGLRTTLQTAWGQKVLLSLLSPECPPEVLDDLLDEKGEEVLLLLISSVKDSMPRFAKTAEEKAQQEGKKSPFEVLKPSPATT